MTQEELKRLEANLTKSALKAQKYYVRGIVGYTPEEQGFLPISIIPRFIIIPSRNKQDTSI